MASLTFLATLPDKSCFSRHSDGGTVRLDVPETEIAAMIGLLALTRTILRVTVEAEPLPEVGGDALNAPQYLPRRSRRVRAGAD